MINKKIAEEYICNGKCQDDITRNYIHCKSCTRPDDFIAGYIAALRDTWHVKDSPRQDGLYYCKIKSTVGTSYYRETEFIDGKWNIVMGNIIAWCEMPRYEDPAEIIAERMKAAIGDKS